MTQPLVEGQDVDTETVAKVFEAMAKRVRTNGITEFGGAFVIVPPKEGGVQMEVLIVDAAQSPVGFWQSLQGKVSAALAVLEDNSRQQGGFPRR